MTERDDAAYDVYVSHARSGSCAGEAGLATSWILALHEFLLADFARLSTEPIRLYIAGVAPQGPSESADLGTDIVPKCRVFVALASPDYFADPRSEWECRLHRWSRRAPRELAHGCASVWLGDRPWSEARVDAPQWFRTAIEGPNADLSPWYREGPRALGAPPARDEVERLCDRLWELLERGRYAGGEMLALPQASPRFVGRQRELAALQQGARSVAKPVVQVLAGPDGVGKTELALALGSAHLDSSANRVWFASAGGCSRLSGPDEGAALGELQGRSTEDTHGSPRSPLLLILDDVADLSILSADSLEGLRQPGLVRVVATTRLSPESVREQVVAQVMSVGPLEEEDALALARDLQPGRRFSSGNEERSAASLVRDLGCLPLHLELAFALIALDAELSVTSYRSRLRDCLRQLSDPNSADRADELRDLLLEAIVARSVAALSSAEREMLLVARMMPPDAVAWPWIERLQAALRTDAASASQDADASWIRSRRRLAALRLVGRGTCFELGRMNGAVAACPAGLPESDLVREQYRGLIMEQLRDDAVAVRASGTWRAIALLRAMQSPVLVRDILRLSEREMTEAIRHLRVLSRAVDSPDARVSRRGTLISSRDLLCSETRATSPRTGSQPPSPEHVQVTVYRPRRVRPATWYSLLAFIHRAERRPGAPTEEADPAEQVRDRARRVLGADLREYGSVRGDAVEGLPRSSQITMVPEIPGVEFNPPRRHVSWLEDVQMEEFRLRASPALVGTVAHGRLVVWWGAIMLAEIGLAIAVDASATDRTSFDPSSAESVRPYRRIFASYSHRDTEIVLQYERFIGSLGDQYLRDVRDLRTGEAWDEALQALIRDADVFQLFWSHNSMRSEMVRSEWEYALSLRRQGFVRPTYWEEPMPSSPSEGLPPEELKRLHFQRIPLAIGTSTIGGAGARISDRREDMPMASARQATRAETVGGHRAPAADDRSKPTKDDTGALVLRAAPGHPEPRAPVVYRREDALPERHGAGAPGAFLAVMVLLIGSIWLLARLAVSAPPAIQADLDPAPRATVARRKTTLVAIAPRPTERAGAGIAHLATMAAPGDSGRMAQTATAVRAAVSTSAAVATSVGSETRPTPSPPRAFAGLVPSTGDVVSLPVTFRWAYDGSPAHDEYFEVLVCRGDRCDPSDLVARTRDERATWCAPDAAGPYRWRVVLRSSRTAADPLESPVEWMIVSGSDCANTPSTPVSGETIWAAPPPVPGATIPAAPP